MAFPEEQIRQEALLCLIYFLGFKGDSDYQLKANETYGPLADFFNLAESDRNRLEGDNIRSAWDINVQGTRERLAQKGYIHRPPPHTVWKLTPTGIEKARHLSHRYIGLKPVSDLETPKAEDFNKKPNIINQNSDLPDTTKYGKGGESERHKSLKNHIANNPSLIGMPQDCKVIIERNYPTGDRVDLMVENDIVNFAVVEIELEGDENLLVGAKQLIKYRALELVERNYSLSDKWCRAILVAYGTVGKKTKYILKKYDLEFYQINI